MMGALTITDTGGAIITRLYRNTNDSQLGRMIGVSPDAVRRFRIKHGLHREGRPWQVSKYDDRVIDNTARKLLYGVWA
jgi:hypothetical protein